MDYERFLKDIPKGKANAVGAGHLTNLWGCKEPRETRKCCEILRLAGYVILADESGYYQPASIEEVKRYVARTSKRIKTAKACLKSAKDLLNSDQMTGQLSLEDMETFKNV